MEKITLCGSTKFKKQFEEINKELTLLGNAVYSVAFFGHADNIPLTIEQKKILDEVHLKKIGASDSIFVIDIDGYIGESTKSEIEYAKLLYKPINYLSKWGGKLKSKNPYNCFNRKPHPMDFDSQEEFNRRLNNWVDWERDN